ncbi:serine/threonine-protein kinase [Krasilnikovia sp. MM14-A1259]|uniref:serine/threonine-protein kinase n=1 Tax=Krasilnikovia sp. MM14-A1259 TaxID=3373539 RepID=UPI003802B60F
MSNPATDRDWAVRVPAGYRLGDWEVTAPIAAGNFGSVYAARHATTGDESALKFVATGPVGRRQFRDLHELAQREVEFSRHAAHAHVVTVLDSLVVADPGAAFDGAIVLVMERAAGSLQDRIDAAAGDGPVPEADRLIVEVCTGLAYLHQAGWVHGDLKPSNILLRPDGSACLADFGLVTRVEGTHGYGLPLGSTDYTPPERADERLGERGVQVRPSADVWALGVTAHQLLTGGAFPVPGATPGVRAAAVQEYAARRAPLRLPGELDEGWRRFLTGCLDPDHTRRPSAADLLAEARALTAAGTRRGGWRARLLTFTLVPLAVLGAAGAVWAMSGRGAPAAPARSATGVTLTVYNAETSCRESPDRPYGCSMGLAVDPRRPYAAGNVSPRRVWHGDQLTADCVLHDGQRVSDEYGVGSTTWYRVATDVDASGHAWLPAVRTRDDVRALPSCPA